MIMDKLLEKYLNENEIKYIEHRHKPVFSVEESRGLKKNVPGLHCKTLFLKDDKGRFYLVGMPAEKMLDSKNFRKHFHVKKIRFGTPEELKEKVNLVPGSVSIFGAIYIQDNEVKLIIDKDVWESDKVGFHPNINTATLEVKHGDLERFYNSLKCDKEIVKL